MLFRISSTTQALNTTGIALCVYGVLLVLRHFYLPKKLHNFLEYWQVILDWYLATAN